MLLVLRIEKQMNRVKSLEIVPQINSLLIYDKDVTTGLLNKYGGSMDIRMD